MNKRRDPSPTQSRKGDKALRQRAAALQEAEEHLRSCLHLEAYFASRWKKDPESRKWIVDAYTRASIESRFAEMRLSEVKAVKVEVLQALTVEVLQALRDTQETCFRAQKNGDAAPLLQGLPHFGLELFIAGGEVNRLFWWWLERYREGVQGDQAALRLHKSVCEALGKGSQGARKKRDEGEQRQERGARDRQRIEKNRVSDYSKNAWQRYQQRTQGMTDPDLIAHVAAGISADMLSTPTPAKKKANELYTEKVRQDLRVKKTVARKTRGFSG